MELEDSYVDIVIKAMNGNGLGRRGLCKAVSIDSQNLSAFLEGNWEKNIAQKICHKLNINYYALDLIAAEENAWNSIPTTSEINSIATIFEMPGWGQASVNAYFIEIEPRKYVLFDTGTQPSCLVDFLQKHSASLEAIFITHHHKDHTHGLDEMSKLISSKKIYSGGNYLSRKTTKITNEEILIFGSVKVKSYQTPGHTADGTSFFVSGLSKSVIVTGDAIFAGSIGGVRSSAYKDALKQIREKILSLPNSTLILPGHGPMTTVGIEKKRNPFFAI